MAWVHEVYYRSKAWTKVSGRSRPEYRRALQRIEDLETKLGGQLADLPARSINARASDKIYAKLQTGPRGHRVRQANLSIDIARRAWTVVARLHPEAMPAQNPWIGVIKDYTNNTKPAATRAEAYALANALHDLGEPHLGAAALIAFEWLQRPENIRDGKITWADFRPDHHPNHVRVLHHKTGEVVWMPLGDAAGPLYPELEHYLAALQKLGLPIVLTAGRRGPPSPYSAEYAQRKVRMAREAAGLGSHVTLDACRHGGMTELGDAQTTEQEVMALSGHKTPNAARLYVKRNDVQRMHAARRRRAWVESLERAETNEPSPGFRIMKQVESQNGRA